MGRPAKFGEERILEAATKLVAKHGPADVSMRDIGVAIGATNGSLFHRFPTRDELLGRLWLAKARIFQNRWVAALEHDDPLQAGLNAALSLPMQVRKDPEGARIMLLHRREDFQAEGWNRELKEEAQRLAKQTDEGIIDLTKRLFGRLSSQNRRTAVFASLDLPLSAVRRYVSEGTELPSDTEELISVAFTAIVKNGRNR